MTHTELINLNVTGAQTILFQFYCSLNLSNLLTKLAVSNLTQNTLNVFYSCTVVSDYNKHEFFLKSLTIKFDSFLVLFNTLFLVCLLKYSNFIFILIWLYIFITKCKCIIFNSFLLDIFREDSTDGESTSDEPGETEDSDDVEKKTPNNLAQMISILQSIPHVDNDTIIQILISILKSREDDHSNDQCIAVDRYIEKLMLSSGVSINELNQLKKSLKFSNTKGLHEKLRCLTKKNLYSISELLNIIRSLNKIKKSIIVLPNGIIIFTLNSKNLELLSLPTILKISKENLAYIIHKLNLKKKLNLYLTKECYNSGYLWEKSFYVSEFLCTFNDNFNKDYLILENLNIDVTKIVKFKLSSFQYNKHLLEEVITSLRNIMQSLSRQATTSNLPLNNNLEFSETDLLTNKISFNVILENIAKIKKTPAIDAKVEQKKSWFQYLKNLVTYVKNKINDLTLPALVVYYYFIKLVYYTHLKYLIVFAFIVFIIYKYVYLNPTTYLVLRWVFWLIGLNLYLYFLWILLSNNISWILNFALYHISLYWRVFLLVDIIRIILIYVIINLPHFLTISGIFEELLYNARLYINNWLVTKLHCWTLLSIYLWPYIYVFKNIKRFLQYAWNNSYYRDIFFNYLSKFLALLSLYIFPTLVRLKLINAGRISAILRWLYWNPHLFINIKNTLIRYTNLFFNNLYYGVVFLIQKIKYILKFVYESNFLRCILTKIILYSIAFYFFFYLINMYIKLKNEKKDAYGGCKEYWYFSDTFGDRVEEKMFDLIPLRYKISLEFLNIEWLGLGGCTFLYLIKYVNMFYVFLIKNLWLYFKHLIYTKYKGSLIEFYCEMHLWIEYFLFKLLGDFLQPFYYIPYYVKITTLYITEIPWLTFMDMHKTKDYFGVKPLLHSIEAYTRYRATLLQYQYWFWKNYQYEFNRKRNLELHVFTLLYWKLYLHYQFKQRHETRERVLKSWYIWWDRNDIT